MLVENIDFLMSKSPPESIGHKAIVANVSDIAAMGGAPIWALISLATPANTPIKWILKLYEGLINTAKTYNLKIVGGDISDINGPIVISIAMGGIAQKPIARTTATPSDAICLINYIGDSNVGLRIILDQLADIPEDIKNYFLNAHLYPQVPLKEILFLAKHNFISSMIDLSDGLARDLPLLLGSNLGAIINIEDIPISRELQYLINKGKVNILDTAVRGGEDFTPLFTIPKTMWEEAYKAFYKQFGRPIYKIGEVLASKKIKYFHKGKEIEVNIKGYEHYK